MGKKPRNQKPLPPSTLKKPEKEEDKDRFIVVDTMGNPVYGRTPLPFKDAERLARGLLAPAALKKVSD